MDTENTTNKEMKNGNRKRVRSKNQRHLRKERTLQRWENKSMDTKYRHARNGDCR